MYHTFFQVASISLLSFGLYNQDRSVLNWSGRSLKETGGSLGGFWKLWARYSCLKGLRWIQYSHLDHKTGCRKRPVFCLLASRTPELLMRLAFHRIDECVHIYPVSTGWFTGSFLRFISKEKALIGITERWRSWHLLQHSTITQKKKPKQEERCSFLQMKKIRCE